LNKSQIQILLSNPVGASLGTTIRTTGFITNDDGAGGLPAGASLAPVTLVGVAGGSALSHGIGIDHIGTLAV
jgi:hypothetical protein